LKKAVLTNVDNCIMITFLSLGPSPPDGFYIMQKGRCSRNRS